MRNFTHERFVALTAKPDLIKHYEKTLGAEHFRDGRMSIRNTVVQVIRKSINCSIAQNKHIKIDFLGSQNEKHTAEESAEISE